MRLAIALMLTSGCVGAAGAAGSAATNTIVAGAVSAVRRAQGDCYTPCTPGTECNRTTGLCERLPCDGRCGFDERCEETSVEGRCVPKSLAPLPAAPR